MSRFTFVHAADLHLDAPVSGVGRTPPHLVEAIRDASLTAWQRLVQLTLDRDAAFLLLAGDICEGLDAGLRGQHQFRQGLETLSARGIQVFMVLGDRDNTEEWSALWPLPPGVAMFGTQAVESKTVERSGQRLATVHGISQSPSNRNENLARQFSAIHADSNQADAKHADAKQAEGLRIGLLHCTLNDQPDEVECSRCSVEDLARAGMQYWALGHAHRHHVIEECEAGALIVYAGTTQGRSISVAEQGPKGAIVVEVEEDLRMSVELVPLDVVRFAMCEISIDAIRDIEALRDALLERSTELRASHDDRDVIVRVRLLGGGPLIAELAKPRATHELLKELRDEADQERPVVWWDRIDIHTSLANDEETLRRRGDFASELLQRAQQIAVNPPLSASLLEQDADPLARLDLQRFQLEAVKPDERGPIVRDAARLAIGVLDQS